MTAGPGTSVAGHPHAAAPTAAQAARRATPLYEPAAGGNTVVEGAGRDRAGHPAPVEAPAAPTRWMATTELGERRVLDEVSEPGGDAPAVRQMAATIARRLSVRPRSRDRLTVRGSGRLVSVPYRYGSDDIDLDRTLEVLTERPVPEDTDIIVRERMRGRRAVVLMVDVSGSMRGEKVAHRRRDGGGAGE